MPSWRELTNLSRQSVTVKPFSVATIDYFDIKPNYYRVQNRGTGSLLCGTSSVPNKAKYDFIVHGESMKMYSEPARKTKLYIFNPTGSPISADVLAFAAEFDPLALALSDIEIRMPNEITSSSVISGFEAALPQGANKIGSVDVANLPNMAAFATLAKQNEILGHLSDVVSHLSDLVQDKSRYVESIDAWDDTNVTKETLLCGQGGFIIHLLTNDGDTDFNVVFQGGGTTGTLTLKPGESIGDIRFIGKVSLTGNNYSYRVACSYTL